jgi:hypothetical protein
MYLPLHLNIHTYDISNKGKTILYNKEKRLILSLVVFNSLNRIIFIIIIYISYISTQHCIELSTISILSYKNF